MEKHHLRGNPFREGRHDHEMIGRKEELGKISKLVEEALEQKFPSIIPVIGPYGMGKSFTLLKLREILRDGVNGTAPKKVLTAYLTATQEKMPSKYALYYYLSVIDDLGEHCFNFLGEELTKTGRPAIDILGKVHESSFRNSIISMQDEAKRLYAWHWLRGESLPAKVSSDLQIVGRIANDNTARNSLLDLCRALKGLDYDGMIFLVDELEQAYTQGKSFSKVLIWLREWFDRIGRELANKDIVPTVSILGCAPETWNKIEELAETGRVKGSLGEFRAFWERVSPDNRVVLRPLDIAGIKNLVRTFLSKAFVPNFKPPEALYPFDEGACETIFEVSQGIPRQVIRCARILLREADDEGKPISRNNAERWLRKTSILVTERE